MGVSSGGQFVGGGAGDEMAVPQFRVGLKFKTVIDFQNQNVDASRGKPGQCLDQSLRGRFAVEPEMDSAPKSVL